VIVLDDLIQISSKAFDRADGRTRRHHDFVRRGTNPVGDSNGPREALFVLFYQPPCGKWYVHSHKRYPSAAAARLAAGEFLHPDTPYQVRSVAALAHEGAAG